jgi:hypothetical protein
MFLEIIEYSINIRSSRVKRIGLRSAANDILEKIKKVSEES